MFLQDWTLPLWPRDPRPPEQTWLPGTPPMMYQPVTQSQVWITLLFTDAHSTIDFLSEKISDGNWTKMPLTWIIESQTDLWTDHDTEVTWPINWPQNRIHTTYERIEMIYDLKNGQVTWPIHINWPEDGGHMTYKLSTDTNHMNYWHTDHKTEVTLL